MMSVEFRSQLHCNRDLHPKLDFQDTLYRALHNLAIFHLPSLLSCHSSSYHARPHANTSSDLRPFPARARAVAVA